MNHQPISRTATWNLVWVLIFVGSVSAVTAIRRNLRTSERFASNTHTLTVEAIHLTRLNRSLLIP